MNHALQILKEEKYRLMQFLRILDRNMHEIMSNIPCERYKKQLDEVDAAILYIEER